MAGLADVLDWASSLASLMDGWNGFFFFFFSLYMYDVPMYVCTVLSSRLNPTSGQGLVRMLNMRIMS